MRILPILVTLLVVSISNTSLAELIFKKAGDQVIITSKLERDDHYRFTEFMENNKDIKTVILRNFPGGLYFEMDFIGDYIFENKLNTAVSGYCYSACAVIFLHGKKRQFTRDFSEQITNIGFNPSAIKPALFLFAIGALKKVGVADQLAPFVDQVYIGDGAIDSAMAVLVFYAFSIQIYCDFSGYTDMALALGFLLQVNLPLNFNSPYAATSIRDF